MFQFLVDQVNRPILAAAETAAIAGLNKLAQLVDANGKFTYQYDYHNPKVPVEKYNLVRHCGTLWAMLTTAEKFQVMLPTQYVEIIHAVERGFAWLERTHMQQDKLPDGKIRTSLVWHKHASLGGNGLALLALAEYKATILEKLAVCDVGYPLNPTVEVADNFVRSIELMYQESTGTFVHKWHAETLIPVDFVSDYYVGEAIFAILRWQRERNAILGNAADDPPFYGQVRQTLVKLAKAKYGVKFQSHWMLYAVSEALQFHRDKFSIQELTELFGYMLVLVDDILNNTKYRRRHESTPIACRTEGLLAACRVLITMPKDFQLTLQRILLHIQANVLTQLQFIQEDGAIVRGGSRPEIYHDVRIDFIQHSISAFTGYVDLIKQLETSQTPQ